MENLLREQKVIVCTGSGGVGKTTLSASLGVYAAQLGRKVLVLTIDPAKRLSTALGIEANDSIVKVPGQNFSGELYAGRIDSMDVFDQFIRESAPSNEIVDKILNNRLYKQLSTTLSGSQEFTSLVKLYDEYKSNQYDLIILDTPPTQHAIDFLHSPEKIYALFQSGITKWFIKNVDRDKSMWTKLVHKGTQTVLSVFHKITGSDFMDELSEFFLSLKDLQENISATCKGAQDLLKADETAFVLVTSFDQAKIQEATRFYQELVSGQYRLKTIMINRAFPAWFKADSPTEFSSNAIEEEYSSQRAYYDERARVFDKFQQDFSEKLKVIKLPEVEDELAGLAGLETMSELIANS